MGDNSTGKTLQWLELRWLSDEELKDLVKGLDGTESLRVNRLGRDYTAADEWTGQLMRMCAFEFTDIECEYTSKGVWKTWRPDHPIIVNAFNPLQAERIFQWKMRTVNTAPAVLEDGIHKTAVRANVRNLRYRLGRAWTEWDGCRAYNSPDGNGWYSDCDPGSPKWKADPALYRGIVIRVLAFQRGLIPEAERSYFRDKVNPAEKFPAEYDPDWKAERTGEFDWQPVRKIKR